MPSNDSTTQNKQTSNTPLAKLHGHVHGPSVCVHSSRAARGKERERASERASERERVGESRLPWPSGDVTQRIFSTRRAWMAHFRTCSPLCPPVQEPTALAGRLRRRESRVQEAGYAMSAPPAMPHALSTSSSVEWPSVYFAVRNLPQICDAHRSEHIVGSAELARVQARGHAWGDSRVAARRTR